MRISLSFVVLFLSSFGAAARADLLPEDEFNALEEDGQNEADDSKSTCNIRPSISVQLLTGKLELPYGPPGVKSYRGSSNASGLQFGVLKPTCDGLRWLSYSALLSLTNHFPSSGRQYDVQAVSWTDIELTTAAVARLPDVGPVTSALSLGLGGTYERFNYSRGTFSFQTLPMSLSGSASWNFASRNTDFMAGVNLGYSKLILNRTLVKYRPVPTSTRASASVVEINSSPAVSGHEMQAGVHFAFSKSAGGKKNPQSDVPEHEMTLLWISKSRTAKGFMSETFPSNSEKNDYDLDMSLTNWVLRWTEQI